MGALTKYQSINKPESYPPVPFTLNNITPIPSATLTTSYQGKTIIITLDSGATVSYIENSLIKSLGVTIRPNGQLAQLAIPSARAASMGEVDFLVIESSTGNAVLRLRALVMPTLSVPCYGGRTFHRDNGIVDDVNSLSVTLHDGRFKINLSDKIGPLPARQPPPYLTVQPSAAGQAVISPAPLNTPISDTEPRETKATEIVPLPPQSLSKVTPVVMKKKAHLLPQGVYPIPCDLPDVTKVLVLPPTSSQPSHTHSEWPPQVCDVALGSALYINETKSPLLHDKNTHFRLLPMAQEPVKPPMSCPVNILAASTPKQPDENDILSQIAINTSALTPAQVNRLHSLHRKHIKAFNDDMSEGFQDADNPYYATFGFRDENRTPPQKDWAPQFNRKCKDLMQAKCDELEQQNIIVDPSKIPNCNVRLVSPSFVQQKARAKHKPLDQCSLDEIRYITCFNALNDSIHPIPGRSSTYNDIIKFCARKKFRIHADLTNSYFQVKVHKKFWQYLGVMTPYRGLRVFTRLGQGLLNSDVHLEQVVTRVLGDEMLKGMCVIARDDLIVGGDSLDQCIDYWDVILAKFNEHNLKLAPKKLRCFMEDTEVYGHKIKDGKVRPSDHIVSSLANTTPDALVTVKQVNSWKGLYKTLIRHLSNLASQMAPFDAACAGQPSTNKFDWSAPGILAAFNSATKHLDKVMETYLPHPNEQLALMPDTSDINLCTGWVLYAERDQGEGGMTWMPVQYASAKLSNYMSSWTPCEKEGVGAVLAIDQVRHWINEGAKATLVLPDNKAVVEATELMRKGKHSKSPRLLSLLASVNRSNVIFRHNSAKAGLHTVPDALSRAPPKPCTSKDCQVHRFLADIPIKVEMMPITLCSITLDSMDPAQLASFATEIGELFGKGLGPIPLGSRQSWIQLQADCEDCSKFLLCKRLGQTPGKKDKNRAAVNRLIKTCEVSKGLIVTKTFDPNTMRETERVYVPTLFLEAILTVMHVRLSHPLPTQLQRIFERYFVAFGVQGLCSAISDECSLCSAVRRYPKELDQFSPSSDISHPGAHMNVDVMNRSSQVVVVNCDRFSNFATATLAENETRESLTSAILNIVTPIRHAAKVEVRTDRARSLQSLALRPDPQLEKNGITIVLGDHANKNSNCSVDKTIRELEEELKRLDPECNKLTPGVLSLAITNLNDRIRGHGLSASQLHFSRDQYTGKNLALKDTRFKEIRQARQEQQPTPQVKAPIIPGQVVYVKGEGTKHMGRDPLLVTGTKGKMVTGQKVLRATPAHSGAPKIMSDRLTIDQRFLSAPRAQPLQRGPTPGDWRAGKHHHQHAHPQESQTPPKPIWRPPPPQRDEDDDIVWVSQDEEETPALPLPRQAPPPVPLYQPPHRRHQGRPPPRRPQERWIVRADIQNREENDQEEGGGEDEQPMQAADQEVNMQEEVRAQMVNPNITRTGRIRKQPDRFGFEKERGQDEEEDIVLHFSEPPSREITPLSSAAPSPDTSLGLADLDQQPPPAKPPDVLVRHRHFSIGGGETDPDRLYPMINWMPYPEERPPPSF